MTNTQHSFAGHPVIKNMTMTAPLDQGHYRHLEFRQPDTSMYWFDIITIPGELIFTGDVGAYVFRRDQDMLRFFRESAYNSNPELTYWSEKVVRPGNNDITRQHSEEIFKDTIEEHLEDTDDETRQAWKEHILGISTHIEQEAYAALADFSFDGFCFDNFYDFDFRDFTPSFQWACHAILHAANTHHNQHQDTQ